MPGSLFQYTVISDVTLFGLEHQNVKVKVIVHLRRGHLDVALRSAGHVDGLARIVERKDIGDQITFTFEAPDDLAHFIAKKGGVALNGTSLTVNWVDGNRFSVHLIPHTLSATNWPDYGEGDAVNLEVDLMARYAARLMEKSH